MSDIFEEVQSDLRAERMRRLMTRFGGLLAGLLLLVLAAVAALQGWRWWEARQSRQAAEAYLAVAALQAPPAVLADRFAGVSAAAPPGYRTLARLREAGLRAEAGERADALIIWDGIARGVGADSAYRELGMVLWGLHALDGGDAPSIAARLAPIAEGRGPWRAAAAEVRALAALAAGDRAEARRQFTALAADAEAPQGVRERATRLLATVRG